ncbi:MAG: FHA domain-containing protein [Planctomycetota bacterium]|nr:MAG: FHA domain-containing protein [Planctomycetota bacterium]
MEAAMPEFYLDFLQGDQAGKALHFDKEVVRVGRSDEADLPCEEMGVSWEHAEFRYRDGHYWIIDSGSTNGTYVNDERAHNARLKDGDVVRFGKKGPSLRFRLKTDAAIIIPQSSSEHPGYAAARRAAGEEPQGRRRKRLPSEPDLPVLPAAGGAARGAPTARAPAVAPPPSPGLQAAEAADPGERHSDLPPAAVPASGGRLQTVLLVVPSALFCAALVLLCLLYMDSLDLQDELRAEREAARGLRAELQSARDDLRRVEVETLGEERRRSARLEEEIARLRRRENERLARASGATERLERQLAEARRENRRLRDALEEERKHRVYLAPGGGQAATGRALWKAIEKRLSPSVVFIATRVYGRNAQGKRVDLSVFGTGFFASDDGHIITNKHVIQPWKFPELASRMVREDISILEDTYEVHCWRGGTRFLRRRGGRRLEFNLASGYSTKNGTLRVVRTAPDVWETTLSGGGATRAYRVHAAGNEDLALLQAVGAHVPPIPLASSDSVGKLDEVMVLGFPAGPAILERGVAETSPAMGTVRKAEETIQVSAAMLGGNSGGPLIDARGRAVGISTRVVRGSETLGTCLRIEHARELLFGGRY